MPRLTITSGALSGQQFSFSGAVVIGRGTYSDIRIDDATVSRRHAEIIPGPDGCWRIRDLGSANGTLFDGKPVRGDQLIDGSIDVVIGEVAATIAIADPRESTGTGERAFPQLIDRLELLAWITSLPARREDPALLIGQILDRMLGDFDGCQR
ncbi:MAG: FHA domain-containing protein, partial [Dokdonella sp.]|uniref:FHA domain-containing protein n=1 Tax=Dokdonella sp. TaxID=2291710 RepID=UPI003BB213D5